MGRKENGFIPVIDLEGLYGELDDRRRVGWEMAAACERSGFLVIANHRVPADVIDRIYSVSREFFYLPAEEKMKVAVSAEPHKSAGYRPAGTSGVARSLDLETPPDLVERFTIMPGADDYAVRWPEKPATFEAIWKEYYVALDAVAMRLMGAFALALDLPEDWFVDKFDKQTKYTSMQANYYPPQITAPLPGQLRAGTHTDYGSLTILFQEDDAPGGLQVLDAQGVWRDVPYIPGTFILNIGDLLARWTNDRWVSTLHRVVNPPQESAHRDRLTIPFFHQPDAEAVIECIPSCQGPANPPRYPPVTSGEWRDAKMLKVIGGQ